MTYLKRHLILILIITIPFITISTLAQTNKSFTKPRIIVTTDITNEPDDQQSLIRLLLYSNDIDIEGLIGSTGVWKLSDPATDVIHTCIDGYARVYENLLLHDNEFPTPGYLHGITVTGNRGYGMSHVSGRGSAGARLIIQAVDKNDDRPVWLLAWGGANTIAQAIWTVSQTRSTEELDQFLSKIRVYDLAAQDDAGAWMAKTYPQLFVVRNVLAYKGMSFRFSSTDWDHTRGGNEEVVTREWVKENIQQNHGPLGELYPDALHLWEGDTPTFFYVLPNGLNDPEQQWQGSWGGRFTREKIKNVNVEAQEYAGADCSNGCFVNESLFLDYWLYADADDHWEYEGNTYDNQWAPIFRWRTDFQNDFAARMDWCILPPDQTNHPPTVAINDDLSTKVIYLTAKPGEKLNLSSAKSTDPDNDDLNFFWWIYPEAGTYKGLVDLNKNTKNRISIKVPEDMQNGETLHLILSVTDGGSPGFTRYRRVVVMCQY